MTKQKTVILGVTGSIAAYKAADLVSRLKKLNYDVHVIMTKNATNIIHSITFETLTGHKCLIDTFDRNFNYNIEHVSLAQKADAVMIAPATANVIGKLASGIADDMLTTTVMACTCKKIIAPAMNTRMFENPILQDNLKKLEHFGMEIVSPASGMLACGEEGAGKLPDVDTLLAYIQREIHYEKTLKGKKVLVTAGGTREAIDPVRFITNHSTGKMGYAIARAAMEKGAEVTLVTAAQNLPDVPFVTTVRVNSAEEMFEAVTTRQAEQDVIIKAAAVADYRPVHVANEKIKKSDHDAVIELERTQDILQYLGSHRKDGQYLCGFSMETENVLEHSREKLEKKKVDMIVANSLRTKGAGFGTDTNIVTLITKEKVEELPILSKEEVGAEILDRIMESISGKN